MPCWFQHSQKVNVARVTFSDIHNVRVHARAGELRETVTRNSSGAFFRIYQPNKWRLKQQKKAEEAVAVAAAEAAAQQSGSAMGSYAE